MLYRGQDQGCRFLLLGVLGGCCALALVAVEPVLGQETLKTTRSANNSVFFELGGSAAFYSLNYERLLVGPSGNVWLASRIGFMYAGQGYKTTTFGIPLIAALLLGSRSHKLEVGVGRVFGDAYDLDYPPGWTAVLGYRYQRRDGGLMFRFCFTPLVSDPGQFGHRDIAAWGGISLGVGF